jgi:hypothetical protein
VRSKEQRKERDNGGTSVFSSANEKLKNEDVEDCNFACGSVWVCNLVSDIKVGTLTEGVWEQGAEENIWTEEEMMW